ncbi:MAG: hypothetical protein ABIV48_06360 [Pyrinomonadaceae bacterium]
MNLLDIVIIYLACGSPFAVYQVTKEDSRIAGPIYIQLILSFLFWPVYAIGMFIRQVFVSKLAIEAERRVRVENIRADIERIAFSDSAISALFEFRETFYRFTGLTEAAAVKPSKNYSHELFKISGHPNRSIASRCHERINRARLFYHQKKSLGEFITVMTALSKMSNDSERMIDLAIELTNEFGCGVTRSDFSGSVERGVAANRTPVLETIGIDHRSDRIHASRPALIK